jgi:hypothetical protein
LGAEALDKAKAIWAKLHPKLSSRPAALEAVQDIIVNASDKSAIAALRRQVGQILNEDAQLTADLTKLIGSGPLQINSTATGDRSIAIAGNVIGGTISTGDVSVHLTVEDRHPKA